MPETVKKLFTEKAQLHAIVHGSVQGVFFRAFVKEQADELNLKGWVRNNNNNTVELVAEGAKDDLNELLARCHQDTSSSSVEKVDHTWNKFSGKFTTFNIIY